MSDVVMPRLSDSMEEGTIVKWLKADGDSVTRGEEIAEIETDKATMTYESDADGVLEIVASEGDTLPVGEVIARLNGEGGGSSEKAAKSDEDGDESDDTDEAAASDEAAGEDDSGEDDAADEEAEPAEQQEPVAEEADDAQPSDGGESDDAEQPASSAPPSAGNGGERVKASPIARRMAREKGLELSALSGTGPGGRIVKADVEAAESGDGAPEPEPETEPQRPTPDAQQPEAQPTGKGDVTLEDLNRTQQLIARRMAESKATVPDFALQMDIDMEEAVAMRSRLKEVAGEDGVVPSFNDMVVKACALALREFPRANGSYKDGKFELHSRVNIGVAVAGQDALIVPTVFDADRKSLGEIARTSRALAGKVRDGKISPPELSGGTFTVSNLGMYGITNFRAVINPPQAAILAVGAIEQRPVVHDGEISARQRMAVTLACDHRILYGADAAQFLARVRALLEQPLAMAL